MHGKRLEKAPDRLGTCIRAANSGSVFQCMMELGASPKMAVVDRWASFPGNSNTIVGPFPTNICSRLVVTSIRVLYKGKTSKSNY